jgi:hypothetical protein
MSQDGKPPVPPTPTASDDWRGIAQRASQEPDPEKLTQLIQELCDSIDRHRAQNRLHPIPPRKTGPGPDGNQQTG